MTKTLLGNLSCALFFFSIFFAPSTYGQDRPLDTSGTEAPPPMFAKVITGKVLVDETNEPIAGIVVHVRNSAGKKVRSVITDENGHYELIIDFRFDNTLTVEHRGLGDKIRKVASSDARTLIIDFRLKVVRRPVAMSPPPVASSPPLDDKPRDHPEPAPMPLPEADESMPPPGPEPLPPLASPPPLDSRMTIVPVYYGTDRPYDSSKNFNKQYGSRVTENITFGICKVSIPSGHKIGEIESPKWWKLEFYEDPRKHMMIHSIDPMEKEEFFSRLSESISLAPKKRSFLFIHGYNTTFEEAAKRTAQMTFDLDFEGEAVFYSWPSAGGGVKYPVDLNTMINAKYHMKEFLIDYIERSGAEEIFLIAHSMGNLGFTEAITNAVTENPGLKDIIKEIILAAPDIDANSFKRNIAPEMVRKLKRPITLYASSKDLALIASNEYNGGRRAGDSNEDIVLVDGIETIDATNSDTSFFGHSYFAESFSILSDIREIFKDGLRADSRKFLTKNTLEGKTYWKVKSQ